MKIWYKLFSLTLSLALLTPSLASAQAFVPFAPKTQRDTAQDLWRAINTQVMTRRPNMTAQSLRAEFDGAGRISGRVLASVLADKQYVLSLSEEEAADLIYIAAFAYFDSRQEEEMLLKTVTKELNGVRDPRTADFALKTFYVTAAAALGRHQWLWRDVQDWAFKQVNNAAPLLGPGNASWAAEVLFMLAAGNEEQKGLFYMTQQLREQFEERLRQSIRRYDWMKDMGTEYIMRGVEKLPFSEHSNQGALISLFAQVDSFFSYSKMSELPNSQTPWYSKATNGTKNVLKMFTSAGGFNEVGRAIISSENKNPQAFSKYNETFYFHAVTPGTDGNGFFTTTPMGQRHQTVSRLITALFVSYYMREKDESSALMEDFVRGYLTTDEKNKFQHYLYMPLQGMRVGSQMHDKSWLDGWERQERALLEELFAKLNRGYKYNVVMTGTQGLIEVIGEWKVAAKLLAVVSRGVGAVAKAGGRQIAKALPDPAYAYLAVLQVGGRRAGHAVAAWNRQHIRVILRSVGWKGGAAAGAGAIAVHSWPGSDLAH